MRKPPFVMFTVSRSEIERSDVTNLERLIRKLKPLRHEAFQSLAIFYAGYDDIPDSVYEIPAVRAWCLKAIRRVPYLFYYLEHKLSRTDQTFAAAIGDFTATMPEGAKKAPIHMTEEELRAQPVILEIRLPDDLARTIARETIRFGCNLGHNRQVLEKWVRSWPWMPELGDLN